MSVRKRDTATAVAEHIERLRARHLVDEMKADKEELRLARWQRADGVVVPDLLKKRLSHEIMVKL